MRLLSACYLFVLSATFSYGQTIDSLLLELDAADSDSSNIAILNLLAKEYIKTDLDSCRYYVSKSLEIEEIVNFPRLQFEAINLIGNYYQRTAEFDSARIEYEKLIPIAEVLEDDKAWSTYYNNVGIIYTNKTQYDSALDFYQKALDYEIKLTDSTGIAEAYNNIGVIHFYAGNVDKCLEYITKSIDVQERSNGTYAVLLKGYNNLGAIYQHYKKDYDSAFKYYDKTRELSKSLEEIRDWTIALNNLSGLFQVTGDLEKALSYSKQAYDVRVEQNNKEGMITSLITLSGIEQMRENYEAAEDYLNKALNISRDIGSDQLTLQSYLHLSENYEMKGDYKNALLFARNQISWKDSVFNESKDRAVSELETKYETEKKEQQIELQEAQLAEQSAELERNRVLLIASILAIIFIVAIAGLQRSRLRKKQQLKLQEAKLLAREAEINATISSQEKERARYARDLHDGFGQMISILNMNLKNLNEGAKPNERQEIFNASSKVIDDMYDELKNICFDLMPQTLIKNGLESALMEFVDRINQTGNIAIELNTFGLEERLIEIQEISLYRISQEWINNILKYSDAQKVTLQITKDTDEITLLIEDNGSGFDKSLLTSGKGNGWKNLNTRSNLIQGVLELETSKDAKGNVLIVNAPVSIAVKEDNPIVSVA
ncbi:tetratricopeptide repeat-containing sensor histidine kinase [Ekhidna sp.]